MKPYSSKYSIFKLIRKNWQLFKGKTEKLLYFLTANSLFSAVQSFIIIEVKTKKKKTKKIMIASIFDLQTEKLFKGRTEKQLHIFLIASSVFGGPRNLEMSQIFRYLELGFEFEFGLQRIRDLAILCPYSVDLMIIY